MKGVYLYKSLHGPAKEYIGNSDTWHGKYNLLWEKLDSRYANRWTMAAEIIRCSIMSTAPKGELPKMLKYIDQQVNYIRSLEQLDLTPAQLAVNVLLLKLPEDLANGIRNGLRIRRENKGQEDFKFSPKEFMDVLNDTVVTWSTTSPNRASSTSVLQTTVTENKVEKQGDHNTYENKTPAYGGGKQGGARGRGGFRDGNQRLKRVYGKPPKCQLCDADHYIGKCSSFPNAISKRAQLQARNKCLDCSREIHEGNCKLNYNCRVCGKGCHLDFLCPGTTQGNST